MRALIAAIVCSVFPIAAQSQCMGYADAVEQLHSGYGEVLSLSMLSGDGSVVQVFRNEKTDTWTMIQLFPNNLACLVLHGTAFELALPKGDL